MTLAWAWVLDMAIGDPEWFPHPVRAIGAVTAAGERWLLREGDGSMRSFCKGALLSFGIAGGSWIVTRWAARQSAIADVFLAWTTLAFRNLVEEANAILHALEGGDLAVARKRLARVVGRDTEDLEESEIARAVIETLAESACDGVIAPLLWLATGGTPAAMAYRAVNTLDSMIGHREAPYTYFGRAAARLDDIANWLPSRLTALCLGGGAFIDQGEARRTWRVWRRDGGKHLSPNAGQCEAAMAGALGVRLGGLNYYGGIPVQGGIFAEDARAPQAADVRRAIRLTALASMLAFTGAVALQLWLSRRSRREERPR